MVLVGAALGSGIGILTGVTLGNLLIKPAPKSYDYLDEKTDGEQGHEELQMGEISDDARQIHPYLPKWTLWPDYERVRWMNSIVRIMWPFVNKAVCQTVLDGLVPTLQEIADQYFFLEALSVEHMSLGSIPVKLGGMKAYVCKDDEAIMECPVMWGSDALIKLGATLRLGPVSIYVPVEVRNIQAYASARITLRPLVETLPCLGALGVSLLEAPHVDMELNALGMGDIMALPGVKQVVDAVVKSVLSQMVLYPRDMIFPIMEDGGVPRPPAGMLEVYLAGVDNLTAGGDLLSKVDPYVQLEIREGRSQKSKVIDNDNNPKYNETFRLIVDDLDNQVLTLHVYDEDTLNDTKIATGQVWFTDPTSGSLADFVRQPRVGASTKVPLYKPNATGLLAAGANVGGAAVKGVGTLAKGAAGLVSRRKLDPEAQGQDPKKDKTVGTANLVLTYFPFYRRQDDEEEDEVNPQLAAQQAVKSLNLPNTSTRITDKTRGVLTVTLIRAANLAGSDSTVNAFVELSLVDFTKDKPLVQHSGQMVNDASPRWGEKFDFVDITAGSQLYLSVYDKPSLLEGVTSTVKAVVGFKKADKLLGRVKVLVMDVVRNTRLKDQFALQEAQQGVLDLKLEWQNVELS